MQEVNAQMVLKLHQLSGEPIANCNYLLTQTNGDYELALKILERILQQRKTEKEQGTSSNDVTAAGSPQGDCGPEPDELAVQPQATLDALESRVSQMEAKFAQLADTLDKVNEKLGMLLEKISGSE